LWLEVSKYPELSKQFSRGNLDAMREGNAPTGLSDGYYQGPTRLIKKYEIHHIKPIEDGGGVYDIDNLRIVTPKLHKFIHYGK
jgi:HNH endonuclease.